MHDEEDNHDPVCITVFSAKGKPSLIAEGCSCDVAKLGNGMPYGSYITAVPIPNSIH